MMRFVRRADVLYGPVPTGILDIDCGIREGSLADRLLRKRGFEVCERHRLYRIDAPDERLFENAGRIRKRTGIVVRSFSETGLRKAFSDVHRMTEEDGSLLPDGNTAVLTLEALGFRLINKYSMIAYRDSQPVGWMLVIRRHFRLRIASMQVLPDFRNRGIPLLLGAALYKKGLRRIEAGVIDERNAASVAVIESAGAVCKAVFCRYNRK